MAVSVVNPFKIIQVNHRYTKISKTFCHLLFKQAQFFRSFVDDWMEKGTLTITYIYCDDEHPLPYLRVNCPLQQFDQFLDLYGIKEGDKMYLAPEDRVNIW